MRESGSVEKLYRKGKVLCGFPNVNKIRKKTIHCKVYSQLLLASKEISVFIFIKCYFCLSFPFLLIGKGILIYHRKIRNTSHTVLGYREPVLIDKTHKVNTVFVDYGQGNGCLL